MRFKLCGGLDAPDWLLKELQTVLSKISSLRVKMMVKEVIKAILDDTIDYLAVEKHALKGKADLEHSDIKAGVAALRFIVTNGAKYDVDPDVLSNELQQLGLPKEIGNVIIKEFAGRKDHLREKLRESTLGLDRLERVDWRVDYVLASDKLEAIEAPSVQLSLKVASHSSVGVASERLHSFDVGTDKFRVLLSELEIARKIMSGM